ncbi:unnamed protein product [Urochloa humidicola]
MRHQMSSINWVSHGYLLGHVQPVGLARLYGGIFAKKTPRRATDGLRVVSRGDGYVPFSQVEETGEAPLYGLVSPQRRRHGSRAATGVLAREIHNSVAREGGGRGGRRAATEKRA